MTPSGSSEHTNKQQSSNLQQTQFIYEEAPALPPKVDEEGNSCSESESKQKIPNYTTASVEMVDNELYE